LSVSRWRLARLRILLPGGEGKDGHLAAKPPQDAGFAKDAIRIDKLRGAGNPRLFCVPSIVWRDPPRFFPSSISHSRRDPLRDICDTISSMDSGVPPTG